MIIWFVMVLFTLSTIGVLMAEINDNQRTRIITKPLLMPLLAVFYIMNAYEVSALIIAALALSFTGDVLLLRPAKKTWFVSGLFAFLMAHVMYIIFLWRSIDMQHTEMNLIYTGVIVAIALGTVIYGYLFRHLGNMKVPVLVYIIIVLTMSLLSYVRMGQHEGVAGWMPFAGAMFFLLSDSLLAFNHFRDKIINGGVYIIASYLFAQIMIICGFILS